VSKIVIDALWDEVEWRARDNANETEGVSLSDRREHSAVWHYWVDASADCIIESMTSEREYHGYCVAPITREQASALRQLSHYHYGQFGRAR
jgi:hypothetical protein